MYLALFIIGFVCLQCLIAGVNACYQLPKKDSAGLENEPLLSVLIPARNEAENIAHLLQDLQQQHYQRMEILVFDDLSTDGTADIVESMILTDSRIRLIRSAGLPDGWLGKNYACHQLATEAKGDYFLFLDADVRIQDDLIHRALTMAKRSQTALLSIFPAQQMLSIGEWLTVPLMNYILLTLLPLPLVLKSGFASLAAANGQFMLFSRSSYLSCRPHNLFRNNKVEDISIARYFKEKKLPVVCITSNGSLSCRMYQSAGAAVNGFAKNILSFFGNSVVAATLFWLLTTVGIVVVIVAFPWWVALLYTLVQIAIRVLVSIGSYQNGFMNILLAIPQQWMMGYLMINALKYKYKKGLTWKGRNI